MMKPEIEIPTIKNYCPVCEEKLNKNQPLFYWNEEEEYVCFSCLFAHLPEEDIIKCPKQSSYK